MGYIKKKIYIYILQQKSAFKKSSWDRMEVSQSDGMILLTRPPTFCKRVYDFLAIAFRKKK